MKKVILAALLALTCMSGATAADGDKFQVVYNFDDDADFPGVNTIPAGWSSTGVRALRRYPAQLLGMEPAPSGKYVLGNIGGLMSEVLSTPLYPVKAGKEYTLQFSYFAPSQNPDLGYGFKIWVADEQSVENAVLIDSIVADPARQAEWIRSEVFSFVPKVDYDLCFVITPYNSENYSPGGAIAFDDFVIAGTEGAPDPSLRPEEPIDTVPDFPTVILTPNPAHEADCMELPCEENFSDASHYNGGYVPNGWFTTGACSFVTANVDAVKAHSGSWYLVADHNSTWDRDDIVYTPFFHLEAGREYTLNFHVFMQGNDWNEEGLLTLPVLHCTVGTEQSPEAHNRLGYFTRKTTGWVEQTFAFTPDVAGPYCFAFMLTGQPNTGYVFIDDVRIAAPGLQYKPEAGFMVRGVYSMFNQNSTVTFPGHQIEMVNTSRHAESYKWSAPGARPSESTAENPRFTFPRDGRYNIILTASNTFGSRTVQRAINIEVMDQTIQSDLPLTLFNAAQDETVGRGSVPAYASDPEGDFVTGFNHYYFKVAQRFDFSPDMTVRLKQLQFFVTDRRFAEISVFGAQNQQPFSLVVYGSDADGNLDESKVLGRIDTTVGEAVVGSGLGGYSPDPRDIAFPEPIEVRGTFYVAMEFDPAMEVVAQDTNIGRSYFSSAAIKHGHGRATLYGKLIDRPAGCDATIGDWVSVDRIDPEMAGLGAYWTLWCSTFEAENSIEAITTDGTPTFAATVIGGQIHLSGLTPGLPLEVYDLNGHLLLRLTPSSSSLTLPASVPCLLHHNGAAKKVA